jgi:hypothetical protein
MTKRMSQQFDQFDCDEVRLLTGVNMFAHPDLPGGIGLIELAFSECTVFVCIDEEFDSLICARTRPMSHRDYTLPVFSSFWDLLIGQALTNAWLMTNDRGYEDGIQMRFRNLPNAGAYTIVQLYGEASQIALTELKPARKYALGERFG